MTMTRNAVSTPLAPTRTREVLATIVEVRQHQLDSLPTTSLDVVAAAHRASVERILDEARAAQRRLEDGSYGECLGCRATIPAERLELRPWAATCARCAQR